MADEITLYGDRFILVQRDELLSAISTWQERMAKAAGAEWFEDWEAEADAAGADLIKTASRIRGEGG